MLQGYINHIAFVLDSSSSMGSLTNQVVQVTDNQIKHLSAISQTHDQETRATVYKFSDRVEPLFYDKDVMRLPSIKGLYSPNGMTALVDATLQAIEDLEQTATLYGDHSFLLFVITDGEENSSSRSNLLRMKDKLASLPSEWTLAILVPNQMGRAQAIKYGFKPDNIQIWDPSAKGIEEVSQKLQAATSNYMTARGSNRGFKGTSNIFNLSPQSVKKAVAQGDLKALQPSQYKVFPVRQKDVNAKNSKGVDVVVIAPFVEKMTNKYYQLHTGFYELSKPETVQPQKRIAIRDRRTNEIFLGDAARQMLGLTSGDNQRVKPEHSQHYTIFIESTSTNRHLVPGTDLLYVPH